MQEQEIEMPVRIDGVGNLCRSMVFIVCVRFYDRMIFVEKMSVHEYIRIWYKS